MSQLPTAEPHDRNDNAISPLAPAKLNLGLAITGRRPDGYHDLVTIFQAVSIFDRLTLSPGSRLELRCDNPALAGSGNLILTALSLFQRQAGVSDGATITLTKRIPVAAGLGGASSDAAAALLGCRRLWRSPLDDAALALLAGDVGSDVPFFLAGGTALATGRGNRLAPLPTPAATWFVVVAPRMALARKTATLYAALTPDDFEDGAAIRAQATSLRGGGAIDPALLPNTFAPALYRLFPALAELPDLMRRHGAPNVALSGAGPSHYAVLTDADAAGRLAADLAAALGEAARVLVATPVSPVARATSGWLPCCRAQPG